MTRPLIRSAVGAGLLLALLARTPAQDKEPPRPPPVRDPYPEFFRQPQTTEEYWRALKFEMEVGRYELAARLLRGLIEKKPTDEELLRLEEKEGTAAFLRLRTVPKWSDRAAVHDQAVKDADELVSRVAAALQNILGDPKRINKFIKNLTTGDREERLFAAKELYRSKAAAIPHLVAAIRQASGEELDALLALLPQLAPETVPPLVAALDIPDEALRAHLIDILVKRGEKSAVPHLWHLAGSTSFPDTLRKKARMALASLLETSATSLTAPEVALTREAERYYNHQVAFANPNQVVIWRWDGQALVKGWPGAETVNASRAEEYYGLRFARQALDIDPTYALAQQVFLSLALDKGVERAGLDQPLAKGAPDVGELLATVNPDLLVQVLEAALRDHRLPVILAATRALGDLAEPRASRPTGRGEPALVKALNYPDRRVQFAAAEALLRIPSPPSPVAAGRVVEVLRRAALMEPEARAQAKVLVGFASAPASVEVEKALTGAGFDAVTVRSGREALHRLSGASDIDALLIDADLPDPGLASLLAQLRSSEGYGGLPLWVVLPADTEEALLARRTRLQEATNDFELNQRKLLEARARREADLLKPLKQAEDALIRQDIQRIDKEFLALVQKHAHLLGVVERREFDELLRETATRGVAPQDLIRAALTIRSALAQAREQLDRDLLRVRPDRERRLRRLAGHYRNVWLLPEIEARDSASLKKVLAAPLAEASGQPLSDAVRRDYAERSLRWLARIAKGELAGYDIRPAEDALYKALHATALSESAMMAAIEATGRLPAGPKPQTELAGFVLDKSRPVPLRALAAGELLRHIQTNRLALSTAQVQSLEALFADKTTDPALRSSVGLVLGATRPDPRQMGQKLKEFEPKPPAVPPPPPKKG